MGGRGTASGRAWGSPAGGTDVIREPPIPVERLPPGAMEIFGDILGGIGPQPEPWGTTKLTPEMKEEMEKRGYHWEPGTAEIRTAAPPTVPKFASHQEAEDWAYQYGLVQRGKGAALKEMPLEVAQTMVEHLHQYKMKRPELTERITRFGYGPTVLEDFRQDRIDFLTKEAIAKGKSPEEARAMAEAMSPRSRYKYPEGALGMQVWSPLLNEFVVTMGPKVSSRTELKEAVEDMRQKGYASIHEGVEPEVYVQEHEMGHMAADMYAVTKDPRIMKIWEEYSSSPGKMKEALSSYALTNPHEMVAEAWAEYRTSYTSTNISDREPRPLAKKIGAIMEEKLEWTI